MLRTGIIWFEAEALTSTTSAGIRTTSVPMRAARRSMPLNHSSAMLSYTPPSTSGMAGGISSAAPTKPKGRVRSHRGGNAPGSAVDACTAWSNG